MDKKINVTDEIEPIVLMLPSTNERIELPKAFAARVWDGVRRGAITDPAAYVQQVIEDALAKRQTPLGRESTSQGAADREKQGQVTADEGSKKEQS